MTSDDLAVLVMVWMAAFILSFAVVMMIGGGRR